MLAFAVSSCLRGETLKPLPRGFYNRDPREVAPALLGKLLVRVIKRTTKNNILAGRIVETEAYLGAGDAAAHSAAGKTPRNAVLFGPPGHAYVYFIYGNHYCLNVSCLPEGDAGCVLIRALEPVAGLDVMLRNRGLRPTTNDRRPATLRLLTSGPGRLCEALVITRRRDNGKDLTSRASDLWIADDGFRPPKISATARVGITKAAEYPLRFLIPENPFVSGTAKGKMQK
jgi:DNA-3-methyladenine glycosylase